jgi:CRISPR-associated endonuclease/helicase Cas3
MLSVDQFAAFVGEVHAGRSPFPWQEELLRHLVREQRWPDTIAAPTGLGKTSVLDIAVFAAALRLPVARRRIFYVVDRRLVVDEAHEHAQRLAHALAGAAEGSVTHAVAQQLRLPDDDRVLDVTRMRGGVTWDRIWLDRPDRHAIVTATVDQVGSRLLFRGYGVSPRARSIDAALVGTDSLIVIDEAHLSQPFVTTATTALNIDAAAVAAKPIVVTMSATTPTHGANPGFGISPADEAHPTARRRLTAPKRLFLHEVTTTRSRSGRDMATALADLATGASEAGGVIGVVVNTVNHARAVFDLLRPAHEAVLLTGRIRPIDRDVLLHRIYPRIRVGRDRDQQAPLIVVATQTVEVGANIDFDALITESAPWSSLVQRLGRLNRTGDCTRPPAKAIIAHDSSVDEHDPIYGPARAATWQYLVEMFDRFGGATNAADQAGLDVSPSALIALQEDITPEQATVMSAPVPYVPVVHESTVDGWARTSPTPLPDQPIEAFLHGIDGAVAPVTVVWRTGLPPEQSALWADIVDALPPTTEEGIDVPVHAVRAWLSSQPESATTDLDAELVTQPTPPDSVEARKVLRYLACGDSEVAPGWAVRPGDTIIVPDTYGGCDPFGWNPAATASVVDVADLAYRRGRPIVRLGASFATAIQAHAPELTTTVKHLRDQAAADLATSARPHAGSYQQQLRAAVRILTEHDHLATPVGRVITRLAASQRIRAIVASTPPRPDQQIAHATVILTVEAGHIGDDEAPLGSSAIGRRVTLDRHQQQVAAKAQQYATNLGLPTAVVRSVTRAASLHDEGKRDPRFQTMLWGGDHAAAELADEPLAKSGIDPADRAAFVQARRNAQYPAMMRHEALSARITSAVISDDPDIDSQLVIHLVASHHGHARPLLPAVTDTAPVEVAIDAVGVFDTADTLDWDQPLRFARLNQTYGRWGLALLETIVRLADIWCSIHPADQDEDQP